MSPRSRSDMACYSGQSPFAAASETGATLSGLVAGLGRREAWILFLALCLLLLPHSASAEAWLPRTDANSVVSPEGIFASLCGLKAAMSSSAIQEITRVAKFNCKARAEYVKAAVWLPSSILVPTELASAIGSYAELYRGAGPFNVQISQWLEQHHARPINVSTPIAMASVSAITYNVAWSYPQYSPEVKALFHGRHVSHTVPFVNAVHLARLEHFEECERVVIPLADGGDVLLTRTIIADRLDKCLSEPIQPYSYLAITRVSFPEIEMAATFRLRRTLEAEGIRSIFSPSTNPLPALANDLALSDVYQSVVFRMNRDGIGVEASTVACCPLSGGGRKYHTVVFDSPFAVRILDSHGADVAEVMVDDV